MMASEKDKAFFIWKQICNLEVADSKVKWALSISKPNPGSNSWLELCREGQWLTQIEMGKRLGLTKSGYRKLELRERGGKITLEILQQAAEAMDCELIYCIRPKQRKWFSILLWEQVYPRAFQIYKQRTRTEIIKPLILGKIAAQVTINTKFRHEKGWARNLGNRSS